MDVVEVNGVPMNYQRVGKGEDVVLIHGLAANHAFWHLNVLFPLAREYRVTVYDLRGHGYSGMPESGYTPAHLADDLHGLLDHLAVPQAHLVGHSVGGVVALHYAARCPERVASLTIVDSRIQALQPIQNPADWPNWEWVKDKLGKLGLQPPDGESEPGIWLLEQLASPAWRNHKDLLAGTQLFVPFSRLGGGKRTADRWLELLQKTTARSELTACAGLTPDRLSTIRQPTLALYGEHSPTLTSAAGLEKCLPRCRMKIVGDAGHFVPLSQPKRFVQVVLAFLEQCRLADKLPSRQECAPTECVLAHGNEPPSLPDFPNSKNA